MATGGNGMKLLAQVFSSAAARRKRRPAVFLDRDGTLIRYYEVPKEKRQILPYTNAAKAVRRLNDLDFWVIVHTNQPIVEKGIVSVTQAKALNEHMRRQFSAKGARIDAVYTCPHRFRADRDCVCRKPNLGLVRAAQKDFAIDMRRSWLVGDTTRDMETGRRAKLKTILVRTGDAGRDTQFFKTKGDYETHDILVAAGIIGKK